MILEAPVIAQDMKVGAATDVGNVRELNEDTIVATLIDTLSDPLQLAAVLMVADGLGGHDAGEVASGLARETVRSVLIDRSLGTAETVRERLIEAVAETNTRVHACVSTSGAHPATTLTLCACRANDYTVVHVGDSRAYLLRGNEVCQVTEDDSWVGEAIRRGQMTPAEAEMSPFRNQLTKSVGSAPSVDPRVYEGDWRPGDVLVLTSDGLTEYVGPAEILDTVRNTQDLQAACEILVRMARERGGHDNISVVAAACSGVLSLPRKPPTAALAFSRGQTVRNGRGMTILAVCLFCAAALLIGLDVGMRQRAQKPPVRPGPVGIKEALPTIPVKEPHGAPPTGGEKPATRTDHRRRARNARSQRKTE
ncbi:MAG: Ptc1 [Chthonomonadaceae bacterium]|nr:Ptc1 [Chthonomonadaceae bacterium]